MYRKCKDRDMSLAVSEADYKQQYRGKKGFRCRNMTTEVKTFKVQLTTFIL